MTSHGSYSAGVQLRWPSRSLGDGRLYTDGLIERHGQPLDDALDGLARLASRPVTATGQFADDLLASATADTGDDTCLVAVRIR